MTTQTQSVELLRAFAQKIIDMNVQYCIDKYGDAAQAESMACVSTARAALAATASIEGPTSDPATVVDEGDDGLFVAILQGSNGTSLKRGDILYASTGAPVQPTREPIQGASIDTWQDRMRRDDYAQALSVYCRAEIADLRTALARQSASVEDARNGSLLREPISATNPLPPGCYCPPGQCQALRIMGRQPLCRDQGKAAAIAAMTKEPT